MNQGGGGVHAYKHILYSPLKGNLDKVDNSVLNFVIKILIMFNFDIIVNSHNNIVVTSGGKRQCSG
jgi:hypothetical protein